MFNSIRKQLTLIICSLIIITLTIVLLINYYLVATEYKEKMQQVNSAMAESLGNNITQFIQNSYNITELMSENPDMSVVNTERQKQLLVEATDHYPFFQLLAIHDLNGNQIVRSSGMLSNRAERWWFKKFMEEKEPYIGKTYYSLTSESPITTIVRGVYEHGNLVSVFMIDIEDKKLQEMVDSYNSGAGGYAYLLDGDGGVIAHPDQRQILGVYNYKTRKKSVLLRDVNGNIKRDEKNNELTEEIDFEMTPSLQLIVAKVMAGETGVGEYTDLNGDENICAYRTIWMPGKSDPWSLIVVQKKSVVLTFMHDVTIKNILAGIVVLLVAVLLAFWFSRRITNPLIEIVNTTNQIKAGDLTVRLNSNYSNEIGVLAMNFNEMVSEIQQHREGLEELVEARTGELSAANQELIAMNEEITDINQKLGEENQVRRQVEENLLLREKQYRAVTSLLTRPVDEFEGLLESILRNALQLVKAPNGYISLYDDGRKNFSFHYGVGIHESWSIKRHSAMIGMEGQVYNTGEIFIVDDYRVYPERVDDKQMDSATSVIMLPLKQEGEVHGVLCACWNDVLHPINTEDVMVLHQFCDLATVALVHANAQKKISYMAFYDTLTGLPNRTSLRFHLEEKIEKKPFGEAAGVIMFIDIDDLKSVNDNFGHSVGDSVIIAVGKQIVDVIGEQAFVARSGDDEFVIVLSGPYNREQVAPIADRILGALCQEYQVSIENLHMSASIGVVVYPGDGNSSKDLLKKADSAMYAAKKAGRNCWRFYDPIFIEETYKKMILTNSLRRALERGELSLYYQPQLTVGGTVIGFEALLRWNNPEHGCVSPVTFIPLAEESGLIIFIGHWVLQEACQFARRLADAGKSDLHVAVNISPMQLQIDDFVDIVRKSIAEAKITPKQLELEVTESVLIESMENSIGKLSQLRDSGVMISLDDFGTGYSSLTYLRSLPVGVLKIDKSFIDKITSDEIQLQLVGSIIDLSHALGLTAVAEGVETEDQLKLLTQCGCDCIQGYIFSPPISEEEAIEFLVRNDK